MLRTFLVYSYTHVDDTTAESALTSLAKFLSEVQIYHSNSFHHQPACQIVPKNKREEYVIYIPHHQFSVFKVRVNKVWAQRSWTLESKSFSPIQFASSWLFVYREMWLCNFLKGEYFAKREFMSLKMYVCKRRRENIKKQTFSCRSL